MERKLGVRSLAPLLVLVLGLAVVGSETAVAHVKTFRTSLTIATTRHTVKAGGDVHLFGNLSSGKARCKSGQTIEVDLDGSSVGTTTTSAIGHYKFTGPAPAAGKHEYQAKFAGSTFGTPPRHQHTCAPSSSNKVTVKVRA